VGDSTDLNRRIKELGFKGRERERERKRERETEKL
jgi:hypothetical protein